MTIHATKPLRDMIFAVAFKVYSTVSARRFMCDLADAHEKGYLEKKPCHSAIFKYMEMSELKPLLEQLIERSSLPLQALETDFAVDASGFSTCRTVTWYNARYGHERDNHDWIKLHLICGVKTNVVTSVITSERHAHDSVPFPALVARTVQNGFDVKQVSADKAYSSRRNLQVVKDIDGEAFISFKSNATGKAGNCELWAKMYHYYNFNRDTFLEHYHKRSNVESTFAMIKAKFGDSIRSKSDKSIINEALCKILCHNICCVIQSMHEFGINSTLWTESNVVHKVG